MSDEMARDVREAVRTIRQESDVEVTREDIQKQADEAERKRVELEKTLFDEWKDSWNVEFEPLDRIHCTLGGIEEQVEKEFERLGHQLQDSLQHVVVHQLASLMSHIVRDTFLYKDERDGEVIIGIHWGTGALGIEEEIPFHEEKLKDILK